MSSHIVIDNRIRRSSTGRYSDRLVEHLQKIDTENTYTILVEPDDPWQPTAANFKPLSCPYPKFSFNPISLFTYGRFLKKLQPDLVHFAMTPQEPVWYFGRRVTTTHDLTMLRFTRAGKYSAFLHAVRMTGYRFIFWYCQKAADRIIVPSKFVASDLAKLHPFAANKTTVTYEASEPPLEITAKQPKGVHSPFIMHVGSPFPHKNINRLVEAFTILKKEQPNLQLVLVGKKEQYFEALEKSLEDHPHKEDIYIPGFVSDAELKWLYQNAEVYVLPSESEGFGLPGLEAMAHGCPLVSSNATCLPEVYGDAAEYFDPLDPTDIAEKVHTVMDDEDKRKHLIGEGYKQIKKYSWQRMAEQTLAIYKDVLEK